MRRPLAAALALAVLAAGAQAQASGRKDGPVHASGLHDGGAGLGARALAAELAAAGRLFDDVCYGHARAAADDDDVLRAVGNQRRGRGSVRGALDLPAVVHVGHEAGEIGWQAVFAAHEQNTHGGTP